MKSTIGRPRKLTHEQIAYVLMWHERFIAWRTLRRGLKSQRQLARELGVSQSTISYIAGSGGRYKRNPPE
jgi:transposase